MNCEDSIRDDAREQEGPQEAPEATKGAPRNESEQVLGPFLASDLPTTNARRTYEERLTFQEDCARKFTWLGRIVWAHNPFYMISACLVFVGLYLTFEGRGSIEPDPITKWWLLGLLSGYTALLAFTAFGIVRLGKVWEDARSILLVVILLFMGTSVSLDEVGIKNTQAAIPIILAALACAVLISQFLIKGLKIRLRSYAVPYYAVLGLFFLYPLGIMLFQEYLYPSDKTMLTFATLAFPILQGVAFLTLIPAIRRGAKYVEDNGTPWRWPGFPLLLFLLLAGGVCVRQYFMSLSFLPILEMASPFGLYFLAPFFLSLSVLAVEYALARRTTLAKVFALAMPLLTLTLSFSPAHPNAVYREILDQITGAIGSPVLLTAIGAALVYAYACWRGVKGAEALLTIALLVVTQVRPTSTSFQTLAAPSAWPLFLIALIQGIQALRRPSSWRVFLGTCAFLAALAIPGRETWFTGGYVVLLVHLFVVCSMIIGLVFRDGFSRFLRVFSGVLLAVLFGFVMIFAGNIQPELSSWIKPAYALVMVGIPLATWLISKRSLFLTVTGIQLAVVFVYLADAIYHILRQPQRPKGLVSLFWGALCFIVAVVISLLKGGVIQRGFKRLREGMSPTPGNTQ